MHVSKPGAPGGNLAAAQRAAGAGKRQTIDEFNATLRGIEAFDEYVSGVDSGAIPACRTIRQAVARHLEDLAREDWPYSFDRSLADRAIKWFPQNLKHSIGSNAGQPFHLATWQAFLTGLIFGWIQTSDGCRRFRKVFLTIARKNGKSTWVSGLTMLLATDDLNPYTGDIEMVAHIVLCATKLEQSEHVIFGECVRMRNQSPSIASRTTHNKTRKELRFTETEGTIRPISSDRAFSGLNPQAICVDEYHEFVEKHRDFIDTMITSQGNRDQPLYIVTTTAGTDQSDMYLDLYNYCAALLRGDFRDDRQLCLLYEIDKDCDPLDPENWIQSNPNLHVSVKQQFLEQMAQEAEDGGFISRNRFLRFHANQTVAANDRAFDLEQWKGAAGEYGDWSEADVIAAGVDLGGRDDLASFALCARFPIGQEEGQPIFRYEIKSFSYLATDSARDLNKQPFLQFVQQGELRVSETPVADLEADLVEACYQNYVSEVAFDPAQVQATSEFLMSRGIKCGRVGQRAYMFHEPITDMISSLQAGRLLHDGNSLLMWAASNAILVQDRQQQVMFDKRSSKDKIDPIVSAAMAYRIAMMAPSRKVDLPADKLKTEKVTTAEAVSIYAQRMLNDG